MNLATDSEFMLIAELDRRRIRATIAIRHESYICPACSAPVILKRGRIKIAHFAHKAHPCDWYSGETIQHMTAKTIICDTINRLTGSDVAELEVGIDGICRPDVLVTGASKIRHAVEVQHSPISLEDLERRAWNYHNLGMPQLWLPFLKNTPGKDRIIGRHGATPFERWLQGFNCGRGLWYWDPAIEKLWMARLNAYKIETYDEGGFEYDRFSKRWRTLLLAGPFSFSDVQFQYIYPRGGSAGIYNWPKARVIWLQPRIMPPDHPHGFIEDRSTIIRQVTVFDRETQEERKEMKITRQASLEPARSGTVRPGKAWLRPLS